MPSANLMRLDLITIDPRNRTSQNRSNAVAQSRGRPGCASLCGADRFKDMALFRRCKKAWFGSFLDLPKGTLSHGASAA
jgi:hypothetical protein